MSTASAADISSINFEHRGIARLLSLEWLKVPLNQRDYAWEREHVKTLLEDVQGKINENNATFFLGTIVLTGGVNSAPYEVADGQQRLATVLIVLAAIRNYFHLNGEAVSAEWVENTFISAIDPDTETRILKLAMNAADEGFFKRLIAFRPTPANPKFHDTPAPASNQRLADAMDEAENKVELIARLAGRNAKSRLKELAQFLESKAQVIVLKVASDADAYTMFETLNDRGLRVSQADLLKNFLFKQVATANLLDAQIRWERMMGALDSLAIDDVVVTFLRTLLINVRGPTREREVFEQIQSLARGHIRAIEFLDELSTAAQDYVAILTPTHPKWAAYDDSIRKHIQAIDYLRVKQIRPLMLAVSRKFIPAETAKAFKMFVSWTVRFLTAGGRGGTLEDSYFTTANKVHIGEITTANQLVDALSDVIPSDTQFEAGFSTARVSQNYLARYYLRALEKKIRNESEPEMLPNEGPEITLEHVLPENPQANWPHIDPETAAAVFKRLGNMALLQLTPNTTMGNVGFEAKKAILRTSAYVTTNSIAEYPQWGLDEINDRQRNLARHAVSLWTIR